MKSSRRERRTEKDSNQIFPVEIKDHKKKIKEKHTKTMKSSDLTNSSMLRKG